jgi:hypothetical protein
MSCYKFALFRVVCYNSSKYLVLVWNCQSNIWLNMICHILFLLVLSYPVATESSWKFLYPVCASRYLDPVNMCNCSYMHIQVNVVVYFSSYSRPASVVHD